MQDAARRPATYEDLEALPPSLVGEILDGELILEPRPSPRRGFMLSALADERVRLFQKDRGGPEGCIFIVEPELHLGSNVVVPDVAAWRRDRLPEIPSKVGIEAPPDRLCDVQSPSTAIDDRTIKREIYHAFGVEHLRCVDPAPKTFEVYERADKGGC